MFFPAPAGLRRCTAYAAGRMRYLPSGIRKAPAEARGERSASVGLEWCSQLPPLPIPTAAHGCISLLIRPTLPSYPHTTCLPKKPSKPFRLVCRRLSDSWPRSGYGVLNPSVWDDRGMLSYSNSEFALHKMGTTWYYDANWVFLWRPELLGLIFLPFTSIVTFELSIIF